MKRLRTEAVSEFGEWLANARHVRFIDPNVPMHIISRVFQGRHLLRPCRELNSIVVGVIGRARQRYPAVRLYAAAFLSNHVHMMLQGPPEQVPAFVGFVKREVSRRWGARREINWDGAMWHRYIATALPTDESQLLCLKYVLSQGVKEGLVARAVDWPGVHCARALAYDEPLRGKWFDATSYSRTCDIEGRKLKAQKKIRRHSFEHDYEVRFDSIPLWRDVDETTRRANVRRILDEIEVEGRALGRPPLGAHRVRRVPLDQRTELVRPPWFARRRRMICWASSHDPDARRYVATYRAFQDAFREARAADRQQRGAKFPAGAYAPGWWTPSQTANAAA